MIFPTHLACAKKNPNQSCLNATELHRAGKVQAAILEYQACVKLHPGVPELRSDFGAALARLGRYEESIEQYREALKISLTLSELARQTFEEAVRRNPNSYRTHG
jgi:Tfp pilus assembly protein PilF